MSKRYKWMVFAFAQGDISSRPLLAEFRAELRAWGYSGSVDAETKDNVILFMREQVSKRMYYDYSGHVDFTSGRYCSVQIPMVGFTEYGDGARFRLTKDGMVFDKAGDSYDDVRRQIAGIIAEYSSTALRYSAGGVAESAILRLRDNKTGTHR